MDRMFRIGIEDFKFEISNLKSVILILHILSIPVNTSPRQLSRSRSAALVDELHDADGDGAEQEDVYEALLAQHEFSHEPRREERRGEQTDVQVNPDPFA